MQRPDWVTWSNHGQFALCAIITDRTTHFPFATEELTPFVCKVGPLWWYVVDETNRRF